MVQDLNKWLKKENRRGVTFHYTTLLETQFFFKVKLKVTLTKVKLAHAKYDIMKLLIEKTEKV